MPFITKAITLKLYIPVCWAVVGWLNFRAHLWIFFLVSGLVFGTSIDKRKKEHVRSMTGRTHLTDEEQAVKRKKKNVRNDD